jgi:hypothetical protein
MKKQLVTLAASLALAHFSNGALAQQAAPAAWSGWARCQITVQGPGYTDQQTHTWTISGSAPTAQGAFQIYAATWSVVGGGSLSRTQGTQTLTAQWASNAPNTSAPLAVFVRASDKRMFIQSRHAQLRSAAAIQGYQQLTISGKPQTPGKINAEAFEWAFPVIAVSAPVAPDTNATANGSSTSPTNGSVGPMQPAGSQGTASCTWQFGQGSAAPAPPPTLTAQAIPTPGNPATTSPPANNPPGTSTPPVSSNPPANPPDTAPPTTSARLVSNSPTTVEQGAIGTVVTLTGQGTHWLQTKPTVVVAPDIGVPVRNAQASSDTELLAQLDVQYAAVAGPRTITVTAGSEVVSLPNAFTVTARARPELVSVTPLRAKQGEQNLTVRLTGRNTRWVQGATRVQLARSVDASKPGIQEPMPGVTVVSTTVHSPTSASAVLNVEANAAVGAYWFQVFDAAPSDWLKIVDGFTVEAATTTRAPIIHVEYPNGGERWIAESFDAFDVTWTHTYPAGQLFDVDFSLDGGTTWLRFDSNQSRTSTNVILHAHSELRPTTAALVRVSPAGNAAAGDTSDAPFTIAAPASATAAPPLTATPLDPALLPTPVLCTLRGPGQSSATPNYATPGSAHLYWEAVAGATGYKVSRSDLGVLTSQPLADTATSYVHLAKLSHPGTYVYTITATYPQGCGKTTISLNSQPPLTPEVYQTPASEAGRVRLAWSWPPRFSLERVVGDYTGVLITGPALPPAGREVRRREITGNFTLIDGVPAGSRTWTVKAYWDTPGGRVIDNAGKSVTVIVP